jgi:uncharacterized XkdX family phage protein
MARMLVESLKRLYEAGRVTREQIADRVEKGTVSAEEYEVITGEPYED